MRLADFARPVKIEPVWHCLKCDAPIGESVYDRNNGVCDDCPKLYQVHPRIKEFWLRGIPK